MQSIRTARPWLSHALSNEDRRAFVRAVEFLAEREGFELTSPRAAKIVSEGNNRVEPPETAEFRHGFRHASTAIPSLDMSMRAIGDRPLSTLGHTAEVTDGPLRRDCGRSGAGHQRARSANCGRCDTKSLVEVVPTSMEGTIRVTG